MKTRYEIFKLFQGDAGSERIAGLYREQQENPDKYFKMDAGGRLTGILDKTAKYLFVPECITEICSFAFAGCNQFMGLFIPRTVKRIQNNLFAYCSKLTWIVVDEENPYYDSRNSCNAIIDRQNRELIAGCGNTIVPADIKEIGQFAFYMQNGLKGCVSLVDVAIPAEIISIEENAFEGVEHIRYNGQSKRAPWGAWNMN